MVKKNSRNSVVELPSEAVSWLWNQLVEMFNSTSGKIVPESLLRNPENFWRNRDIRRRFFTDFGKITGYNFSGMRLLSRSKGSETGNIPEEYIYKHFIICEEKLFQEDYLNKIIFYLTRDKKTAEYNSFFLENGINIIVSEPKRGTIAPGLTHLEGYWIGLNRNLEEGAYAKCTYRFLQVDNVMQVQREAYSSEIVYNGSVHVQGDSNFLIELVGQLRGKKKFIVADSEKLRPQSIRCISSGFEISTGGPIFIKELLIKLPSDTKVPISNGALIEDKALIEFLKKYYDGELLELVENEIKDFLGTHEIPYVSLKDLSNIKKEHLRKINQSAVLPDIVAKKVNAYIHFNKFDTQPYSRDVIKYFQNISKKTESAIKEIVDVYDEYLYIKNTQYELENYIKHRVYAEAEDQNGVVDVQSLFPILKNDSDNDLNMPSLKVSNRIMDAYSDNFLSSATFINDFSKTYRLSLKYDVKTLFSEMVIDFCSTPNVIKSGIYLDEIVFIYNEPDGESSKQIKVNLRKPDKRGINLLKIDKESSTIDFEEIDGIDILNEGIFSIKIDCITEKDEAFYFQFKTK